MISCPARFAGISRWGQVLAALFRLTKFGRYSELITCVLLSVPPPLLSTEYSINKYVPRLSTRCPSYTEKSSVSLHILYSPLSILCPIRDNRVNEVFIPRIRDLTDSFDNAKRRVDCHSMRRTGDFVELARNDERAPRENGEPIHCAN